MKRVKLLVHIYFGQKIYRKSVNVWNGLWLCHFLSGPNLKIRAGLGLRVWRRVCDWDCPETLFVPKLAQHGGNYSCRRRQLQVPVCTRENNRSAGVTQQVWAALLEDMHMWRFGSEPFFRLENYNWNHLTVGACTHQSTRWKNYVFMVIRTGI